MPKVFVGMVSLEWERLVEVSLVETADGSEMKLLSVSTDSSSPLASHSAVKSVES